ncbi:acyl carrier protein [Salmonella enterica subsp. enterica serovar Choleraesuis]|nr:acyl carrier protein [Salmonella enterica subsp. enterica serovar Choleraesuis]
MQYEEVYARIANMIADAKDLELNEINPQRPLAALELDSLDYVELMVLAKREFNISLEAELFIRHPHMTLEELCKHIVDTRTTQA